MIAFISKALSLLTNPKVTLAVVGVLTVLLGVTEYLSGQIFVQQYPQVIAAIAAVQGVLAVALRVAKLIVGVPTKAK